MAIIATNSEIISQRKIIDNEKIKRKTFQQHRATEK